MSTCVSRGVTANLSARSALLRLTRERLVERARADGSLRPDVDVTDMPMIQVMIGASVDYTRDVDPEVWHRMFTLVIDGLRATPADPTPMPAAPLDSEGLVAAMTGWGPRRARGA